MKINICSQRLLLHLTLDIQISPTRRNYNGIVHAARRIVSEEGWRGLYKGLSINLFRTVPNSAVTMLT